MSSLAAESVDGSSLPFQGVDDVKGGDGFPASVLGVGYCVTDDSFQEGLENSTGFFVDKSRNSLHTTTTSKSSNGGLSDSLDVISKDLAMTLSATLAKAFSSFTSSGHLEIYLSLDFLSGWGPKISSVNHIFRTEKSKI